MADKLANVEGDEIVIRIPLVFLKSGAMFSGVSVTDVEAFAPHVAREILAEDASEDTYLNKLIDGAIVRAVECDAPGATFVDIHDNEEAI